MDLELIRILNLLDRNKTGKISIPELECEAFYEDKLTMALLLLPILKYNFDNLNKCVNKKIEKSNVNKAFEFIRKNAEKKISYVGIVGDKSIEAYEFLINKIKSETNDFKEENVFMNKNIICVPFDRKKLTSNDLLSLSLIGVTIFDFGFENSRVYVQGFEISHSNWGLMPFIEFANILGYTHEEYFLGELLYYLSVSSVKLKNLILDNLNSVFVLSLVDSLEDFNSGYYKYLEGLEEDNQFENLIGILTNISFNKIKDMKYFFVRDYLYDNSACTRI